MSLVHAVRTGIQKTWVANALVYVIFLWLNHEVGEGRKRRGYRRGASCVPPLQLTMGKENKENVPGACSEGWNLKELRGQYIDHCIQHDCSWKTTFIIAFSMNRFCIINNDYNLGCFIWLWFWGSKKTIDPYIPESCRTACCEDKNCAIWQFREDAGCFFGKHGHGCASTTPEDFEKFIGKRKVVEGREYAPYAYSKDFADLAGTEFQN